MRWFFSWTFYWLGDVWHRCMEWSYRERGVGWVTYKIYQRMMLMADTIQGDSDHGPWGPVQKKD